jgi:hypothetical protein
MKTMIPILAALGLAAAVASGPLAAEELVREFNGERSTETADFQVDAPWLIDWRVNSDYSDSMGFDVELVNAPMGDHAGRVVKTKQRGSGLRLVNESGRFRFKVESALAYWTIKVIQLTPEEAEAYTAKGGDAR